MTNKSCVDMHIHSTFSDGTCTPEEIVQKAGGAGLGALILTDHDTCAGWHEMKAACDKYHIETIPGIEISTSLNEKSIHILGYGMDPDCDRFKSLMEEWQTLRRNRNRIMIERMMKDGIDISEEAIIADCPDAVITRANMAAYLMKKGVIPDIDTGFKYYLSRRGPYYEPVKRMTPFDAVKVIKDLGGIAVFAHPILTHMCDTQLNTFTGQLAACGLDGVEGLYSGYTEENIKCMKWIALNHNLLITGGSDFHGTNKPDIKLGTGKGSLKIPYSSFEAIKRILDR